MRHISFDGEADYLHGQTFAIGVVVTDEKGNLLKSFIGRSPVKNPCDFVKENVLPAMEGIEITHDSYGSLLKDFSKFYLENKEDSKILVHMGLPVEAKILIDAHDMGFLGDWDLPYPLIDISALPAIGTSPDTYNEEHDVCKRKLEREAEQLSGGTHNPLYDSWSALVAYLHEVYGETFE